MKRNLPALANTRYDLLIIGGGIYGACVAWDASLRGLSVALIEKTDFSSATSANSLKIIHGGLRYLQHADFKRARESISERKVLMRIAPHLIHPLPVLLPTYGHGLKGREIFALGLWVNDLIGFDRNRSSDPQKYLPKSRTISKKACLKLIPGIDPENISGGAIFYDAQVFNSERLPLAFLRSASEAGAQIANYVEAVGFLQQQNNVKGVIARDVLTGQSFEIQAKMVINTTGPWVNRVLNKLNQRTKTAPVRFAKAFNLVTRSLFAEYAVGISGKNHYQDSDSIINKGSRFFFIAPWRGYSLVGTEYQAYNGHPDEVVVTEEEIETFIAQINQVYPAARLQRKDVYFVHKGLVPMSGHDADAHSVQLTKHYQIHDHRQTGIQGLISVVGVKYTTARNVAEKTVNRIFEIWQKSSPVSTSATTPVYGGHIEQMEAFLNAAIREAPYSLNPDTMRGLIYNYGTAYQEVLNYFVPAPESSEQALLKAMTLYGIHHEMAMKLTDIVFRRTDLGTVGYPGESQLKYCAEVMGAELGWNKHQISQEIQTAEAVFASLTDEPDVHTKQLAGTAIQ